MKNLLQRVMLVTVALLFARYMMADDRQTMAKWTFNYDYTIVDGTGTPSTTEQTGNGSVNLHDVKLKPNMQLLPSEEVTLTAHRPTIATQANQVNAQDSKGAYLEVNAINCDGAALHMTSPVPTPLEPSTSFTYGQNTTEFPDGLTYSYQAPYNYFEIEACTSNYAKDMELTVNAAGHNSQEQYYAVAWSSDKTTWNVVGDEYLTGASYNRWNTSTINLPIGQLSKVYVRIFPAKNWKGASTNVNSDNQFDLDDVTLSGTLEAQLASISAISIEGQTVKTNEEGYDFLCRLPKTYDNATTTFFVETKAAKVSVYAEEEGSGDEVDVTDNGNGSYTIDTPRPNNSTIITLTVIPQDGAMASQTKYTFRLFHAGELLVRNLTVDGIEIGADVRKAINTADSFTATLTGNTYTDMPEVTATGNDGSSLAVTSSLSGTIATYVLTGADRVFTLQVEGVYIYHKGENDEDYTIVYSADGKAAYVPKDNWTDGWTDGLYTLRSTSLDGWGGQQFKFNAADNLLEVPGGVVVKELILEKYGANYGDGEGLTSVTSEGAIFRVPTNHGYTRGGKATLKVVAENHQAGAPIAFTITGGNQPYAQLRLVIEKTNPGTTPQVRKQTASVVNNHAMVSIVFDREMASTDIAFGGEVIHADRGTTLNFGITGLDYSKDYTFTLPAGKAEDLFGNKTTADITVNFATQARAAVTKKTYDYVVGTSEEFSAVIKSLGTSNDKTLERVTIFLKNGDYDFGENNEQRINRGNVSLIGQSRDGVILHGTRTGISNPILNIRDREGFYLQDITVRNDLDFRKTNRVGVGVAIYGGNKSIMKNVCMQSQQDTQVTGERSYFDQCRIQGTVDYICGGGDQFYDRCQLIMEGPGSVIAAPATTSTTKWGYVFSYCTIERAEAGSGATMNDKGDYALSRPWQNYPATYYLFTQMMIQPTDNGYAGMASLPTRFYEYGSTDKDGKEIDLSGRGNSSTSTNQYTPVLSADEVKNFTIMSVLSGTDGWLPTDYTELTKAPVVTVNGKTLSWMADDQVRTYVIFKDGNYIANTTETFYNAEEDGEYTIRTANEMGGLSADATTVMVGNSDGIVKPKVNYADCNTTYSITGQRVNKSYKGIVIVGGKKIVKK